MKMSFFSANIAHRSIEVLTNFLFCFHEFPSGPLFYYHFNAVQSKSLLVKVSPSKIDVPTKMMQAKNKCIFFFQLLQK